jgi:hypothetical protein
VELHPDAFARIRSTFADDEELVALFGSYDDRPPGPRTVAVFRNLLHHHMHHSSPGRATTFWTGIGAIRRDRFATAGGFDGSAPSVADIELGLRLTTAGARIELDPRVQGTHHKAWTLVGMVRTDLFMRGVPWVELVLRYRGGHTALNLGWRNRLSALAAVGVLLAGVGRRPRLAVASLAALIGLNRSFYALLVRRLGWRAAAGLALHIIHLLTAVVALPVGVSKHLRRRTWTCPYT